VSTINHVRLARLNPLIARECGDEHAFREEFPFWLRPAAAKPDRYTRHANICPACRTAKALGTGLASAMTDSSST
jgi:hypothetical protein